MLRQGLYGQQNRNVNVLRRNLAQRGALDSGSLGAGIGQIGNETSGLLAQGTNLAANNEAEGLLSLIKAMNDRSFAREQSERDYQNQRNLLAFRNTLERNNKPSGLEGLLSGVGAAAGQALPFWLSSDREDND